jgi:tetratricopeptide (TPR) repeat protein
MLGIGIICLILGFIVGFVITTTEPLIPKWWLWIASGIIVGVASAGVVQAGHDWLVPCASAFNGAGSQNAGPPAGVTQSPPVAPGPATSATKTDSNSSAEKAFGDKLESYDKRADNLERILSLLIAFSTIYAAVLALGAVRDANESKDKLERIQKEATKGAEQSRAELDKILEQLKKDVARVKENAPLVGDIEYLVRSRMRTLTQSLPTIDLSKKKYADLSDAEREQFLFYEKTMAGSEYFDLRSLSEEASEIYHSLGNFYALKSKPASPKTAPVGASPARAASRLSRLLGHVTSISTASSSAALSADISKRLAEEDLARSRFYLHKAIELNPQNTVALNDFGYLELEIAKHPNDAKPYFEKSLARDPNQQRARYNLATMEITQLAASTGPTEALTRAVQWLAEALAMPRWQGTETAGRYNADILYNRACAYARTGERASTSQEKHARFEQAMADLETSFARPDRDHETLKKGFCPETGNTDADLEALASHPGFQHRFKKLRMEVCGTP